MNPKNFALILSHLIVFFFFYNYTFAQRGLEFVLILENKEIGNLDPIIYELNVINKKNKTIKINAPWEEGDIRAVHLMYKKESSSEWKDLRTSYGKGIDERPIDSKTEVYIESKDSLDKKFGCLSYHNLFKKFYFEEGESYEIKAVFEYPKNNKKRIYSNIVKLKIKPYKGENLLAKEWLLKNTKYPAFMYSLVNFAWGASSSHAENKELHNQAKQFIALFPNSNFTPWVRVYLAGSYSLGHHRHIRKEVDFEKARNVLNTVKKGDDIFFNEIIDKMNLSFDVSEKLREKLAKFYENM